MPIHIMDFPLNSEWNERDRIIHILYTHTVERHEEATPCKCSTLNVCTLTVNAPTRSILHHFHIVHIHTHAICVHTYVCTYIHTPAEIDPPGVSRFGRCSSVLGPMDQVFERKGKLNSPIVIYTRGLEQIAAWANKRWSVLKYLNAHYPSCTKSPPRLYTHQLRWHVVLTCCLWWKGGSGCCMRTLNLTVHYCDSGCIHRQKANAKANLH